MSRLHKPTFALGLALAVILPSALLGIASAKDPTDFVKPVPLDVFPGRTLHPMVDSAGTESHCVDNDDFACRAFVGVPSTSVQDTDGFALELTELQPCGGIGATAWYEFVAPASGFVAADSLGSNYDTVIAAYSGSPYANTACNDDTFGLLSYIQFPVVAGSVYYVQAGGYLGSHGVLQLNLYYTSGLCLNNDDAACATGVPGVPSSFIQSTSGYTAAGELQPCAGIGATAWFRYTPTFSGWVTIDTYGSNYDTVVALYSGSSTNVVACDDDSGGYPYSYISWYMVAGTTYYIQAGGYGGSSGTLQLNFN